MYSEWFNAEFVSEEGQILTRRQMAYGRWKEGIEVVSLENGYLVDEDLFIPLETAGNAVSPCSEKEETD